MSTVECSWCGESTEDFYRERIDGGKEGDRICWDCHHDAYDFTCYMCEEYGDVDDQHDQHKMLVVADAEEAGLDKAGIYRITGSPYYRSGFFEMSLITASLTWAAPLPAGFEPSDGYPCGHLCADCDDEMD